MNTLMRAAAIDAFGPPEALRIRQLPRPRVSADGVLIRVIYAGVQLTDAAVRSGWSPPGATIRFPQVLGNEISGIVEEVGPAVRGFVPGEAVLGFNLLGCYAEYVAVPHTQIVRKPDEVPWAAAGALSASGQTAHTAMDDLSVTADDVVVVHGAAGGVGTMFTQLAVQAGATVIGTASDVNHDYLRSLGAIPVAYGPGQDERIRAAAARVDVAFDAAGHENLRTSIKSVADRNRVATIVDMQLADDLGCRVIRSRRSAGRLNDLVGWVADGRLRVHIRNVYTLDDVAEAHRDVESGHGRGKVVLAIGQEP